MRLRRAYYVDQPAWIRVVYRAPRRLRTAIGLDDTDAARDHRIELGVGPFPQPGFIHFDTDWTGNHLEAVTPAWAIPVPDGWASEIVAVHMFEHIHPSRVNETLREWRRALAAGGRIQVHVPNAPALMERFLAVEPAQKWKFSQALLGMYGGPDVSAPEQIRTTSDHQLLLDAPLMLDLVRGAGYVDAEDVSGKVGDRHTEAWAHEVDQFSLVVTARKPS
ncbi:MAG: hypothetical protein ACRDRD_13110 [Pseudonocardiaceae bacterium]